MVLTLTVKSKFGKSVEKVEINSMDEYHNFKSRLKRLHARDGATVFLTGEDFFEQVV